MKSAAWYIWVVEKEWVDEMLCANTITSAESSGLERYLASGFADFEKFDATPITLKSRLFGLMEKWNEGFVTKESWSRFYENWKNYK